MESAFDFRYRVTFSLQVDVIKLLTICAAKSQGIDPLLPMPRTELLRLQSQLPVLRRPESGIDGIPLADELMKAERKGAIAASGIRGAFVSMKKPALNR